MSETRRFDTPEAALDYMKRVAVQGSGFTRFAESAEPEEVLDLLNTYHAVLGPLVHEASPRV